MSTTVMIQLPDDVGRRAEERAAGEGTTLSAVLQRMVEEFADGLGLLEEAEDVRVAQRIEARIERGEGPIFDRVEVGREPDARPISFLDRAPSVGVSFFRG